MKSHTSSQKKTHYFHFVLLLHIDTRRVVRRLRVWRAAAGAAALPRRERGRPAGGDCQDAGQPVCPGHCRHAA